MTLLAKARQWGWKEKQVVEIPQLYSIEVYNRHMDGVDLMDMILAHYLHTVKGKGQ